jgi:hypothetical protein
VSTTLAIMAFVTNMHLTPVSSAISAGLAS